MWTEECTPSWFKFETKLYLVETRKEPVFVIGVLMNNGYCYQNINVMGLIFTFFKFLFLATCLDYIKKEISSSTAWND